MSSETAKPKAKRVRRSTEEIVDRLVDAAIEEFEQKGYSNAATAAIARRAGVAEALLFKHFGSKAQLFQDTIFKPLDQHFDDFMAANPEPPQGQLERRAGTRDYINDLLQFVSGHAGMFQSLVFTQAYKADAVDGVAQVKGLHDYFARMAAMAEGNMTEAPRVDPGLIARISFASILGCTLFRDWLFPEGTGDDVTIDSAICDFLMDGLSVNDAKS